MHRSIRRFLLTVTTATGAAAGGALTQPAGASSLLISAGSSVRAPAEVEADYTTTHVFVNETTHDSIPITVFFNPQASGAVASAEVFTNLNRRDWATAVANEVEEGIEPPDGNTITAGDDSHYYKAYAMTPVSGGYQLTLDASKTGAYRLTARYRLASGPPRTYHWYEGEQNAQGILKRDHAIVVSPPKARDVQLYEANPLTITATGTAPDQRGTFASMAVAAPSASGPGFSLAYLEQLGANALWLQPIHPREIEARPAGSDLGSPYGVKNYFAVMPLTASSFVPGATPQFQDTPQGRAAALAEFQDFMRAASAHDIRSSSTLRSLTPLTTLSSALRARDTGEMRARPPLLKFAMSRRACSQGSTNTTSARPAPAISLPLRTAMISASGGRLAHLLRPVCGACGQRKRE